jgi:hypothetical protein
LIRITAIATQACLKPSAGDIFRDDGFDRFIPYHFNTLQIQLRSPARQVQVAGREAHLSWSHNDANKTSDIPLGSGFDKMPSLLRFLVVVGAVTGLVVGGLYVLATQFEPAQREVTKPVPNVKIRRP